LKRLSPFLSLLLTPLVAVMPLCAEFANGPADPLPGAAKAIAEASVPGASTPNGQAPALKVRLADNTIGIVEANSSQTGYSIVVTDASGLPVSDVAVAIRLPEEGATGFFVDGAHSAVAYTDATGTAKFAQVNWSSALGVATIRVTAVKGDIHAGALLEQTIVQHLANAEKTTVPSAKIVSTDSAAASPVSAASASAKQSESQKATATPAAPTPGMPASVASVHAKVAGDTTPAQTASSSGSAEPVVSVVNSTATTGGAGAPHGSSKKWVLLAVAVGAGVGAAVALGLSGKGAAVAAASSSGLSIGTPNVSVGH
jgi:hypothetical protein